jgi:hypothetical protein
MGKYDPLDGYFAQLAGESVEITFDDLEEILESRLPRSARTYQGWWSSAQHHAMWAIHGWRASPDLLKRVVRFHKVAPEEESPQSPPEVSEKPAAADADSRRLILVGGVSEMLDAPSPAKDLYTSTLWEKRRHYAESTGMPWMILSARHGLVGPDEQIEPYDLTMSDETPAKQQAWSLKAAQAVIDECERSGIEVVEAHAASVYLENGLVDAVEGQGIRVSWPLQGQQLGEQYAWYDSLGGPPGVEPASSEGGDSPDEPRRDLLDELLSESPAGSGEPAVTEAEVEVVEDGPPQPVAEAEVEVVEDAPTRLVVEPPTVARHQTLDELIDRLERLEGEVQLLQRKMSVLTGVPAGGDEPDD